MPTMHKIRLAAWLRPDPPPPGELTRSRRLPSINGGLLLREGRKVEGGEWRRSTWVGGVA